ncbi:MAG: response regulator, partial [Pseudomonadota bacterium]
MSDPASSDGASRQPAPDAVAEAHVMVVDDDARIRDLLARFLVQRGYRVSAAKDAAHARRLMTALNFDLLIVDVMMPGEDGLSLTRSIEGRMPVLVLTAQGDIENRIAGLEAGADDYLSKPFEPRELLLRMAAILRRAHAAPPSTGPRFVRLGDARFDVTRGELAREGEPEAPVRLTTAETALMRLFARRPNEAISRAELLAELGGEAAGDAAVAERAVDVQITRL